MIQCSAGFHHAVAAWVNGSLTAFRDPAEGDFVFRARRLPVAVVERGDPQAGATYSYQGKVGAAKIVRSGFLRR